MNIQSKCSIGAKMEQVGLVWSYPADAAMELSGCATETSLRVDADEDPEALDKNFPLPR